MLALLLLLTSLQAEAPSPPAASVLAVRLPVAPPSALDAGGLDASTIVLDGRLDEPGWALAPVQNGFKQREPKEGADATDDTEVRILFDATTLYVGILARDKEPEKVIARIRERDRLLLGADSGYRFAGDDAILLLLDPFRDRRNAFVFGTNANGAEYDALIADESEGFNSDWRGVWRVAALRGPKAGRRSSRSRSARSAIRGREAPGASTSIGSSGARTRSRCSRAGRGRTAASIG